VHGKERHVDGWKRSREMSRKPLVKRDNGKGSPCQVPERKEQLCGFLFLSFIAHYTSAAIFVLWLPVFLSRWTLFILVFGFPVSKMVIT